MYKFISLLIAVVLIIIVGAFLWFEEYKSNISIEECDKIGENKCKEYCSESDFSHYKYEKLECYCSNSHITNSFEESEGMVKELPFMCPHTYKET